MSLVTRFFKVADYLQSPDAHGEAYLATQVITRMGGVISAFTDNSMAVAAITSAANVSIRFAFYPEENPAPERVDSGSGIYVLSLWKNGILCEEVRYSRE